MALQERTKVRALIEKVLLSGRKQKSSVIRCCLSKISLPAAVSEKREKLGDAIADCK